MDTTGLPSGTVYPALRRMEAAGLIDSAWETPAMKKYVEGFPPAEGSARSKRAAAPLEHTTLPMS